MARKFPSKRKLRTPPGRPSERSWAVVGCDVSLTSMSGAALAYDALLDEMRGPGLFSVRWERPVHFLDRLGQATRSGLFILDVIHQCGPVSIPTENIWIAVEEPWPAGIVKRADSGWLRQQAQVQGAFIGGLYNFGFHRIYEANNQVWKGPIRTELGVSKPDKWHVKQWAMEAFPSVPDLVDLIDHGTRGLIPKPESSKAKPRQPDDVYDALGILAWMQDTRDAEVSG